jgi:hypothetical protein
MATKKITLNELRSLVKQIIKEEYETPKHLIVRQWVGKDSNLYLVDKPESQWDEKDYDLYYRLLNMVEKEGKIPSFGKK